MTEITLNREAFDAEVSAVATSLEGKSGWAIAVALVQHLKKTGVGRAEYTFTDGAHVLLSEGTVPSGKKSPSRG